MAAATLLDRLVFPGAILLILGAVPSLAVAFEYGTHLVAVAPVDLISHRQMWLPRIFTFQA